MPNRFTNRFVSRCDVARTLIISHTWGMESARSSGHPGSSDAPMLTVAAVAARLGVAPATLRTWDRRYGVGPSGHVAGSHRRYSGADLARLMVMRRLTLEGVAPMDAARIARRTDVDAMISQGQPPEHSASDHFGTAAARWDRPGVASVIAPTDHAANDQSGVLGNVPVPRDRRELRDSRSLVAAVNALDEQTTLRILHMATDRAGIVTAWNELIEPALLAVVGHEDLVTPGMDPVAVLTGAVMTVLRRRNYLAARRAAAEPTVGNVLVGAGDDHVSTMAAHIFAAALVESSVAARVITGPLVAPVISAGVSDHDASVVVILAWTPPRTTTIEALSSVLAESGHPEVLLAGPAWPNRAVHGAHRVRTFTAALHETMAYLD